MKVYVEILYNISLKSWGNARSTFKVIILTQNTNHEYRNFFAFKC